MSRAGTKHSRARGIYPIEGREGWYADLSTSDGRHRAQRVWLARTKAEADARYGQYKEARKLGRIDREALDGYRATRRHRDPTAAAKHPTLADAWSDWEVAKGSKKSFYDDRKKWEVLSLFLSPGIQLRKLTARQVDEALARIREDRGIAESTLNRYRAFLRAMLRLASERAEVGFDPANIKTTKEAPRDRVLDDEEIAAILECVDSEARTIEARRKKRRQPPSRRSLWKRQIAFAIRLALMTSRRRGDIVNVAWNQVDLTRGKIFFERTKNGAPILLGLAPEAVELIKDWKEVLRTYSHPTGPEDGLFVTQADSISKEFARVTKKLGILDARFHDQRRTAATHLFEAGYEPKTAAAITGHKSLDTLHRHYHRVSEQRRDEAAGALGRKFGASS